MPEPETPAQIPPKPPSKIFVLRILARWKRAIWNFWHQNSGEWKWLEDEPLTLVDLTRNLWRVAVPSAGFFILLGLSSVIATLGLLAGSAATIIGAMIIAPMMGPIISIALAIVVANRRLLRRASMTLALGVAMNILIAMLLTQILGLRTLNPEIVGRIRPSLLDLGVALAAGVAGAYAKSRSEVSDALPGVAIAVALVPPLSVVGIGLAYGSQEVGVGSLILFATNLIGIIFSGALVFLLQRYGSVEKAKSGLLAGVLGLILLVIPLGISLRNILLRENVRNQIERLLQRETLTFSRTQIESLQVRPRRHRLYVEMQVTAQPGTITETQVELVRQFLASELSRTIDLTVSVIPAEFFETTAETANSD
ncbi:TIGR00341 family protein [Synechococcales cyanobacterium C]|uniref:TIGR00341 family protein n=1 Tax=Petrachloros mirabilis ULC683 TaxID=2781853 RepID=A0A8K1ZXV1_9CYAN|nr:TIGR00341 family protein [Petrachloros mirabilis]NCJ06103.1 TIGR00341 family protein [Petrachloros mirabilis ULC683]